MKNSLITILRDQKTASKDFRHAAERITHLLAQETFQFVKEKKIKIVTPIGKTRGKKIAQNIVLIPILRSGLAFLPTFLYYFENARVGFLGLKRDENTAEAHEYYRNIPPVGADDLVIVLDPMLATGGSATLAIRALMKGGIKEEQIIFVSFIASPAGIKKIIKTFRKIKLIVMVKDKGLNKNKYIVPGIGDFGDRYFGT